MTQSDPIVCKPTPWFLVRAAAMLLMFSVFAVMFYMDGSVGYRKKNESYYLHQAFQQANKEFSAMNTNHALTPEAWKTHAEAQSVAFPEDVSILPKDLKLPMPWPEILHDYERMKPLQWNLLWKDYTARNGLSFGVPDEPYSAEQIRDQWIVFAICCGCVAVSAFFLIRTSRRSLQADDEAFTAADGRRIPYRSMKVLDLRKWETKGLAFVEYDDGGADSGKTGKARIDGLTYGGFKKEKGEPAECLMRRIRTSFSGEILEYTEVAGEKQEGIDSPSA
ncbi:MAG: hypothetical protein QM627_09420 [Luteolibacter sp.]